MNIVLFSLEEINKPLSVLDPRASHLRKILRKKPGECFEAGIINGPAGIALITAWNEQFVNFIFTPERAFSPLPALNLIIGFPRPIQLKRLLRDTASLGVCHILLTATETGEKSYLESTLVERGAARASLVEGASQAKDTAVPELSMYKTLAECLAATETKEPRIKLLLDPRAGAEKLSDAVKKTAFAGKKVLAAIGSERGWTENERQLFRTAGFTPYSLGKRILRTETAAITATSLILTAMEAL